MTLAPTELPFRTGSPTHIAAVLACVLAAICLVILARKIRQIPETDRRDRYLRGLRNVIGWGCLVVWLSNTIYWLLSFPFQWAHCLPLHFCNLANLIGAAAVLGGGRFFKSVLYFWAVTLCLWAFITPVLNGGPGHFEFWIFWCYHLFIGLAVLETFLVQKFRPTFRDLVQAWGFTIGFATVLAVINRFLGSNYGFTGPSIPSHPTLLDFLGPYPLRLLWMGLIGSLLFFLAWLPWKPREPTG